MPRKPRNPGSGKAPYNGPASGAGWGGHARGAGNGNERSRITEDNSAKMQARKGSPEAEARRERRIATMDDVKATWTEILDDINAPPLARISAGEKLADRLEGRPVQKNINVNSDDGRSDADLRAELAELERRQALANSTATVGEELPPESSGVLH